jgi:F-type H+-transporting ATPase subunit epsilon
LITLLVPGEIEIKNDSEIIHLASMGGFVEIDNNAVKILSDSAVRSDEIDAIAAEEAKVKAEQALKDAQNDTEIASASAALEKSLLHLRVARKRHHR